MSTCLLSGAVLSLALCSSAPPQEQGQPDTTTVRVVLGSAAVEINAEQQAGTAAAPAPLRGDVTPPRWWQPRHEDSRKGAELARSTTNRLRWWQRPHVGVK
jgi:hypothetical protein